MANKKRVFRGLLPKSRLTAHGAQHAGKLDEGQDDRSDKGRPQLMPRSASELYVKAEMNNVAVGDDVVLAFEP